MPQPLYTARATVTKVEGVHRRARLPVGPSIDFGVHGPIKDHYRLEAASDLPLPVDYLVAATGAWMLGTLNGALEVRQVSLPPDAMIAEVEGVNEVLGGIPALAEIRVHYRLRIPTGSREVVDRALSRHQQKCPTAQTLKDAVKISWTAELEEA